MPYIPLNEGETDTDQELDDRQKLQQEINREQSAAYRSGMTPEREGKIYDDAKRFNIDPNVLRNLETADYRNATAKTVPLQTLTPATSAFLKSSPQRQVVAQDDVVSLFKIENLQKAYRRAVEEELKLEPVGLSDAWQQGTDTARLGKTYYRALLMGKPEAGDQEYIAEAVQRSEDYAKRSQKSGMLRYMLTSATEMIPLMLSGGERALKYGLATGTTAAGMAAIAGQLGPQALAPEELATVPGAALIGMTVGASMGLAHDMMEIEAGHAIAEYSQLTDDEGKPMDPTIARAAALGVGAINAGLEVAGLKALSKTLPTGWLKSKFGNSVIKKAMQDPGVASSLAEIGKRYATAAGGEAVTEMAQESATIIGKWAAANLSTLVDGQQFNERDTAIFTGENMSRVLDAGKQALAAATVLGAPGISAQVISSQRQLRHQETFRLGLDKINEAVNESITKGRSQEAMRDFLQLSGNDGAAYIDADKIGQIPPQILAKIGVTPAQQELSESTGEDVRVRIENVHTRLERDEFKLINDALKPTADTLVSPEQIKQDVELAGKISDEEINKAKLFKENIGNFRTQLTEAVKELPNLRDQAIAAGLSPAEYAQSVTKLVERFAQRMSLEGKEAHEIIQNLSVRAFKKGSPLPEEIQQDISDEAKSWLATLSDAERAALQPSLEYLKSNPDPKGDKANLQMVLEMAKDRELHQGAIRLDAPGKSLAFVDLLRQWRKAHGDRTPIPGSKEWIELTKKADEMDAQRGLVLNQSDAQMPDIIDVDGIKRSTLNSNGKRIAQTEEQVRNFWRWFGDSKVVDEQGRPLVVYHGTNTGFDTFSGPAWFSSKSQDAGEISLRRTTLNGGNEQIYKGYLRINNPLRVNSDRGPNSLIDEAITEGRDGVIGNSFFVVVDPSQIKSATGNTGNFDPTNPSILAQAEQINNTEPLASFNVDERLIKLFSGANLSSVLHELGHFFLDEIQQSIASGVATESLKKDWSQLNLWMQSHGIQFSPDKKGQGYKKGHEAFARAFEEYLFEGKAPDAELANLFNRFSHWLKRVYQHVMNLGRDRIPLTDDVRGFFDRMLSSEPEAQSAAEALSLSAVTEAELDGLKLSHEEKERVRETLDNAKKKTIELIDRARNKNRKALEKEWRDEAAKQIVNDPVYQAMAYLKSDDVKGLRFAHIRDTYGDDTVKALREKGLIASKETTGEIADVIADKFKFPDGDTLILALLDAHPSRKAAEDAYVAEQARKYDASFKAEELALDAQEYQDYLSMMNGYLNAVLGREPSIKTEAYRLLAEQQMMNYQMKDATKVGFQMATLQKLLKRERRAILAGDFETALVANEQARLAFERAKLAREAQKMRDSLIKRANKNANADRGKLEEQHHLNLINVLQRYGLLKGKPERFEEWLKQRNEIGSLFTNKDPLMSTEGLFGDWLMKDDHTQEWQDLTVSEFKELNNLTKYLNARGRALVDDHVASLNLSIQEAHAELLKPLQEQKTKPPVKEGAVLSRVISGVREFFAATDQLLFVFRRADNFSNIGKDGGKGASEKLLYTPLAQAFSERLKLTDKLQKIIKPHTDRLLQSMAKHGKVLINAPIPPTPIMQQRGKQWTYESVIAAALNMGNEYNRQALLDGHGMTESDLMSLVSILTTDDWRAVQGIWDAVDSLWPAINSAHYRINQFHQDKVQAKSFDIITEDGKKITLSGGYYPVSFDPELSDDVAHQTEAEQLLQDTAAMFPKPSVRKGLVQKRQGTGGKPVRLSLGVLGRHLDHAVQYITHAELIRDLNRVMINKVDGKPNPYKAEIERTQGIEVAKQLQPALNYIARPEGEILDSISKFLERQRSLATAYLLGLNLRVAALQITGATTMLTDLGAPHYFKGIMHTVTHPVDAWKMMREMSPYMERRAQLIDRDINHSLKQFTLDEKSIKGITLTHLRSMSYVFIWIADAMVSVPAWWGAYYKALNKNGGDSAAAVTDADELIAATNPSARPVDLAHFQRSNKGIHRLFTMFSTFTFKYGNRQRAYFNAWKSGEIDSVEYLRYLSLEALLPPMMMSAGVSLLQGNDVDDDEWKKAGLAVFLYQIQGLPFARDVIGALSTKAVNATLDKREFVPDPTKSALFAGYTALERATNAGLGLINDLDDDKKMGKAVWAFADLASYRFGVPAPKMARNIIEGMRQWEEEDGTPFNILVPDSDKKERK